MHSVSAHARWPATSARYAPAKKSGWWPTDELKSFSAREAERFRSRTILKPIYLEICSFATHRAMIMYYIGWGKKKRLMRDVFAFAISREAKCTDPAWTAQACIRIRTAAVESQEEFSGFRSMKLVGSSTHRGFRSMKFIGLSTHGVILHRSFFKVLLPRIIRSLP